MLRLERSEPSKRRNRVFWQGENDDHTGLREDVNNDERSGPESGRASLMGQNFSSAALVPLQSTPESKRAGLVKDKKGVVYVEFLIVFPPLYILFLVILQSAILNASQLGVQHAAASAVRAAIVVIPDDPVAYDNSPAYEIDRNGSCTEGFFGKFAKVLTKFGVGLVPGDGKCLGGPRMSVIRFAAIMRMLPFSPNPSSIAPDSFGPFIESLGAVGWMVGAGAYAYGATAVTFPKGPGSDEPRKDLNFDSDKSEEVTVRVTYLAHCGIPIARFLMCDTSHSLGFGFDFDLMKRDYKNWSAVNKRIKKGKADLKALEEGVGNRTLLGALMLSGRRFRVMRADATLPLQSAPYDYQSK